MREKIWIDGKVYTVWGKYTSKAVADNQKKTLKATGTLSSVRVTTNGKIYIVAVKGLTERGRNIQKHENEIRGIIKRNLI